MNATTVVNILEALEKASVQVWLDGGWGVDALLQRQTRDHADLDIILDSVDVSRCQETLIAMGFRIKAGGSAANFILVDDHGREIDVHPIEFDHRGYGFFRMPHGRQWPFPPAAFAGRGRVDQLEVRCLSADAQVQCHGQGYMPTDKDLLDMEHLQKRFGVVLPINLCGQKEPSALGSPPTATTLRRNQTLDIQVAHSDEEIDACFPVMSELRPHLERTDFVTTVREMGKAGYEMAFLSVGGRPVAVAGYRVQRMLCCASFLYVDDLVTTATERSQGYGAALLEWLVDLAREKKCRQLHLDSGVQREEAHRFYLRNGMSVSGLHFRIDIQSVES